MTRDAFDGRLSDLFHPGDPPRGFSGRVVRAAAARAAGADRLTRRILDRLSFQASGRGITRLHPGRLPAPIGASARRLIDRAHSELREYFDGRRAYFTVPIDLSELPGFQKSVLRATSRIPFGETRAYAWIARRIGNPRAVRAVGTALGRNPVPLIVPCHRVLRSDGVPGGYGLGSGLKPLLLDLERSTPRLEGNSVTRVICRVGCPASHRTRVDRRIVFASVEDASSVGYRSCRICRPQDPA